MNNKFPHFHMVFIIVTLVGMTIMRGTIWGNYGKWNDLCDKFPIISPIGRRKK